MKRQLTGTLLLCLVPGCASTLVIKSSPTNASVKLVNSGVVGKTEGVIPLPDGVFGGQSTVTETAVFALPGHRDRGVPVTLRKGERNETAPQVVQLERLDTILVVTSEPSESAVMFNLEDSDLPGDWKQEFRTPAEFECTSSEARQLVRAGLRIRDVSKVGYVGRGQSVILIPGEKTTVALSLRPIITTLAVDTDPADAVIEDVADGGFTYLGRSPVIRNFTWEDVAYWAEKKKIRTFDAVTLRLKISKRGFREEFAEISIPIGEQRSCVRNLLPLVERIHFTSDPPGASVYTERNRLTQTGTVTYLAPLGTTPATQTIDPAEPFEQGAKLVFRKSGYREHVISFVDGNYSYHVVLEPMVPAEKPWP